MFLEDYVQSQRSAAEHKRREELQQQQAQAHPSSGVYAAATPAWDNVVYCGGGGNNGAEEGDSIIHPDVAAAGGLWGAAGGGDERMVSTMKIVGQEEKGQQQQQQQQQEPYNGSSRRPSQANTTAMTLSTSNTSGGGTRSNNNGSNSILGMDGCMVSRSSSGAGAAGYPHSNGSSKRASAAMIGMDGAVYSHVPSRDGSKKCFSSDYEDTHSELSSQHYDEDFEQYELVPNKNKNRYGASVFRRSILRCLYCGICLVLALILVITISLRTKNARQQEKSLAATAMETGPICDSGVIHKDLQEPVLQILISGLDSLPDEEETRQLEAAIMEGYNQEAGGCADMFQRYMYNVTMAKQFLSHDLVLTNATTRLENVFEEHAILSVEFETKISCHGCSPENAFASEYPLSFGRLQSEKRTRDADFGYRQLVEQLAAVRGVAPADGRELQDASMTNTGSVSHTKQQPLNAGMLLDSIEASVRQAVKNVQTFREVTILVRRDDGAAAATTMYKEIQQDKPEYPPQFFRNKIIQETRVYRECEQDNAGRNGPRDTIGAKKSSSHDTDELGSLAAGKKSGYVGGKKTGAPTGAPTGSVAPSEVPTASPSAFPSESAAPSEAPTASPSASPSGSVAPSAVPTASPSAFPSESFAPTGKKGGGSGKKGGDEGKKSGGIGGDDGDGGSGKKCNVGDDDDDDDDDASPSVAPTPAPTPSRTFPPTRAPTLSPTPGRARGETDALGPTSTPTKAPTKTPSQAPIPTQPTRPPPPIRTASPTPDDAGQTGALGNPTATPTKSPSDSPTKAPSNPPTPGEQGQTDPPTKAPSDPPTKAPSDPPTKAPSKRPTPSDPGQTDLPTKAPSDAPTKSPSKAPSRDGGTPSCVAEGAQDCRNSLGEPDNSRCCVDDNTVCSRDGTCVAIDGYVSCPAGEGPGVCADIDGLGSSGELQSNCGDNCVGVCNLLCGCRFTEDQVLNSHQTNTMCNNAVGGNCPGAAVPDRFPPETDWTGPCCKCDCQTAYDKFPSSCPNPNARDVTAVCSVCGEGKKVTNPTAMVTFENQPDQLPISCEQLEAVGAAGLIPVSSCEEIPDLISACDCEPF